MTKELNLPKVDLHPFIFDPYSETAFQQCIQVTEALKTYGAVLIKDQRIPDQAHEDFLDMMETYFQQPRDVKMEDARSELGYQVGVTPDFTESPICFQQDSCMKILKSLAPEDQPVMWQGADPKWRFCHRLGKTPKHTKFPSLNAPPVVPKAFRKCWLTIMNTFGEHLLHAIETTTEMLALGLGLDRTAFTHMCEYGPHLLSPTGSDLSKYHQLNTVFAGFHYDLNFLTIHGQSRFPGLNIWARNTGSKMAVSVPKGYFLVQAAKQLEILTGGTILAGYHEVVVTEATLAAMKRARSHWRVSSTLFYHVASDELLRPLPPYIGDYPPILCGDFVRQELEHLELAKPSQ